MRNLLLVSLSLLTLAPVFADESLAAEKRVTIDLGTVRVKAAIEALFKDSGKTCMLDTRATAVTIGPLSIRDAPFDSALRAVLDSARLQFSVRDGTYYVSLMPADLGQPTTGPAETELRARELLTPAQSSPSETPSQTSVPPSSARANDLWALLGKSRYEVTQAVGKPTKVEYTLTNGCERWIYKDEARIVEFRNCRVFGVDRVTDRLAVSAGPRPQAPADPVIGWTDIPKPYWPLAWSSSVVPRATLFTVRETIIVHEVQFESIY